jgi:hypothetical protein
MPSWQPRHRQHREMEVLELLGVIIENEEKIMAAIDDLQAADAAEAASEQKYLADVLSAIQALQAENDGSVPADAVETIVASMQARVAALDAADASLPSAPSGVVPSPGDASAPLPGTDGSTAPDSQPSA